MRPHKASIKNDEGVLENHLKDWRARKLSAIRKEDVRVLHARIGKDHPTGANRIVAFLRSMFNRARDWGLFQGENPATGIHMFKEVKRDRFLHPEELPRLFKALKKEPSPFIQVAFLVSLLTGARKSEVLTMKWEDVHFDQHLWRIPKTKAGHPHLIPLPEPLVKLLMQLPHIENNPYVFPGRHGQTHLKNINKAWYQIRTDAKLPDVRIHDLRRTLGSWLAGSGTSLPMIGKILNHSQPATTQIYARLILDPLRTALNQNAQKMLPIGSEWSLPTIRKGKDGKEIPTGS